MSIEHRLAALEAQHPAPTCSDCGHLPPVITLRGDEAPPPPTPQQCPTCGRVSAITTIIAEIPAGVEREGHP